MRIFITVACAVSVYALGVMIRWGVLNVQEAREGSLPFTMESALAFRYGEMASNGACPLQDALVNVPEGLKPFESLNVLAPVALGKLYAILKNFIPVLSHVSLQTYYHKISALVFCLGVLAIFACAQALTGSLSLSVLAALGYALLIPSVMRSTGQELMNENFALPFLWIHFSLWIRVMQTEIASATSANRRFWLPTILSALSLAVAWLFWDMVQVYLVVWIAAWVFLCWKSQNANASRFAPLVFCITLGIAAVADPYLRTHGAWASTPMALLIAFTLAGFLPRSRKLLFVALVIVIGFVFGKLSSSGASYHHFEVLFWNKLKFLNVKPSNPALLPYEARALWVPALHSATWSRTWSYFGPALILWLMGNLILATRWIRGQLAGVDKAVLCMGFSFWFLAVLFVRMEVFWVFLACLTLVMVAPRKPAWKKAWASAMTGMLVLEAGALVMQAPALGRDVDYRALDDVVRWVRNNTQADRPVLASFSLSPSFVAYAQRPIVLQPKYETPSFRQKIKAFEDALMAEQENKFYLLCKTWGVRYYIHSKGFYADHSLNSFRYLVGNIQPSSKTNLFKLEINPQLLNCFRLLYQNDKYLVYRVVDVEDLDKSQFCLALARSNLAAGIPAKALRWCYRALNLNPGEDRARILAVKAYSSMGDMQGARQEATRLFQRMQVQVIRQQVAGTSAQ